MYFYVVLFIILYKLVFTFKSLDQKLLCHYYKREATAQYYRVVLLVMWQKVVLMDV